MAIPTIFHFSKHANNRGDHRNISSSQFMQSVMVPDKKAQLFKGDNGGFVTKFTKKFGSRELTVIAELKKEHCWFITGYWKDL